MRLYALSGDSIELVRVVGALLGTLTVLLVMLIAGRVWDRRTGLVAGGLAAVSPALVYVNGSLVSEQLFLPLMLGAVLVTLVARQAEGRRLLVLAALAGVALRGGGTDPRRGPGARRRGRDRPLAAVGGRRRRGDRRGCSWSRRG